MSKTYKIRRFQNGKNKAGKPFVNYSLTIPSHIADALPEDVQFTCELTEDGIVFRPATAERETVALPSWAKGATQESNGSSEAKPAAAKRSRKRPAKATA